MALLKNSAPSSKDGVVERARTCVQCVTDGCLQQLLWARGTAGELCSLKGPLYKVEGICADSRAPTVDSAAFYAQKYVTLLLNHCPRAARSNQGGLSAYGVWQPACATPACVDISCNYIKTLPEHDDSGNPISPSSSLSPSIEGPENIIFPNSALAASPGENVPKDLSRTSDCRQEDKMILPVPEEKQRNCKLLTHHRGHCSFEPLTTFLP